MNGNHVKVFQKRTNGATFVAQRKMTTANLLCESDKIHYGANTLS